MIVKETVLVTMIITATPIPTTETPVFTPTPEFAKWKAIDTVNLFKENGLEIADEEIMKKDDYGLAPLVTTDAIHFYFPSLCPTCGGRIYSFESQEDLQLMESYYVSLGEQSAMFFSWVFVKDNVLVQINGDLPEDQATEYENALSNLSK